MVRFFLVFLIFVAVIKIFGCSLYIRSKCMYLFQLNSWPMISTGVTAIYIKINISFAPKITHWEFFLYLSHLFTISDPSVSPTPTTTTVSSVHSLSTPYRICLIGTVVDDSKTVEAARTFGVPVISSETGEEFLEDTSWLTYFIMNDFEGPLFEAIQATGHR